MTGVKSTGPFRPVNVEEVAMTGEKLRLVLHQTYADISIHYTFQNDGPARKVRMGFPCAIAREPENMRVSRKMPDSQLGQLDGFSLTMDGRTVKSKRTEEFAVIPGLPAGADGPEAGWYGKVITSWQEVTLEFAANAAASVEVQYRNPYFVEHSYVSENASTSAQQITYLFSAAGLWKGPIKQGEVTIEAVGVPAADVRLSHPKRFERSGNTWTWRFTDFEPTLTDDLTIMARPVTSSYGVSGGDKGMRGLYVCTGLDRSGSIGSERDSGRWALHTYDFTATASSTLPADEDYSYEAANLAGYHGEKDVGWSEGAKGDGIGESVTLALPKPRAVSALTVRNGYQKDEPLFRANNRVREVSVQVDDRPPFRAVLDDSMEEQEIRFPKGKTELKQVKLTIESVYPGEKFQDTCLSGIAIVIPLSKAPHIKPAR